MNKNKIILSYITPLNNFSKKKNKIKYDIYLRIILFYFLHIRLIVKFIIKKKKYFINNINVLKSPNRHKKHQYNLREHLFKIELTLILNEVITMFSDILILLKCVEMLNLFEFNTLSLYNVRIMLVTSFSLKF